MRGTVMRSLDKHLKYAYTYLMTIEQTIEIPVNHRITLDLPPELPAGKTKVEMSFTPLFKINENVPLSLIFYLKYCKIKK
jgi:hypothetical protein